MVYRKEDILYPRGPVGKWIWLYDQSLNHDVQPETRILRREQITFNNPVSMLGTGADVGSPYWSQQETFSGSSDVVSILGLGRAYKGTIHAWGSNFHNDERSGSTRSDTHVLAAAGATAIARTIPTNPVSGGAVFIGELKQGLPSVVGTSVLKDKSKFLSGSGKEYLNTEFGWKPMIRDLRSFASAVKQQNKVVRQLHRDSGKRVRRRYHFPTETTVTKYLHNWQPPKMVDGGSLDAWFQPVNDPTHGWSDITATKTRKRWFSGAYRFYVPEPQPGFWGNLDRWEAEANKLLGTRLTPSVVWELAPWSWAVDWFSTMGDNVKALSAMGQDGLYLEYGYMMEETTHESTIDVDYKFSSYPDNTPFTLHVRESLASTSKFRIWGNPFGFGVGGSLSPTQFAISTALGASRAGRVTNL